MVSGEKTEEFREPSDWIKSRLFNNDGSKRDYDEIEYTNGYGSSRPRFITDFVGFELLSSVSRMYTNGLKVETNEPIFVIRHSHVISTENV
jgi:hypothetical protein